MVFKTYEIKYDLYLFGIKYNNILKILKPLGAHLVKCSIKKLFALVASLFGATINL